MRARADAAGSGWASRAIAALATGVAVGAVWLVAEAALLASDPLVDRGEVVRRGAELVGWQVALFALVGAALALPAWLLSWRREDLVWWTLAAASFLLLAARVVEGLLRQNSPRLALAAAATLLLALVGLVAGLRAAGRLLPPALRAGWPWGVWCTWTLLFLPFLRRAGPSLGNGKIGPAEALGFFVAGEVALAAAGGALALLVASGLHRRRAPALGAALLVFLAAGTARTQQEAAAPPDVVVLLIDTYRFDHLGANVGHTGLTPNLDAFAAHSIRFERAFSPSNVTSFAMPGVMASLAPRTSERHLAEEASSLAELLHDAGYRTLGVSTNPNVSVAFGYEQGFDRFLDSTSQPDFLIAHMLQVLGVALPDLAYRAGLVDAGLYYPTFAKVARRGLALFEGSPRPTFLYLHTMDPHGPYLPPRQYLPEDFRFDDFFPYYAFNEMSGRGRLNAPEFAPHLHNLEQRYAAEVRYTDDEFGRLVEGLRALGRFEESLVVVLSDHGEAFGEHDFAGHGGGNLSATLIRVPLLLKLPRSWGVPPRVETTPVSTLDLMPTLLGLLGLPAPPEAFGVDLTPLVLDGGSLGERTVVSYAASYLVEERAVLEIYTAIAWPWKLDLLRYPDGGIETRLFDLEADPGERTDLARERPEVVSRLEREAVAWRAREQEYLYGPGDAVVDDRVREQLRHLGYVE